MVEARITSATAAKPVRGAVRDPSSLRRRLPRAEVHGAAAAAVVGVAVVGGKEKGGKSPCLLAILASLASLHHAYAPLIIVNRGQLESLLSSSSSSATNATERVTARRRERQTITSFAIGHRVLRKTNPI